jgi:NitT/TauT family transport system substrate-binding protein
VRVKAARGLLALGVAALIGTVTTGAMARPSANIAVKVTVFPAATPSLGVYIADALGFFSKNHIDIQYANVGTGSAALQALVSGSTDFTISDVTGVTLARRNTGIDVRFVAGQFTRFMGALQCRNGAGISGSYPDAMKQLVGKKVGITAPGSSTDTYLRYTLLQAGVDPSKVSIIGIGGVPNLVAAIQAGSVDCITSYQPVQQLIKGKVTTLVDWAKGQGPKVFADNYPYNGLITSSAYAQKHPGTVRLFANAMREADNYGKDPAHAGQIASKVIQFFPGIDPDVLQSLIADMAPTFGFQMNRGAVGNAAKVFNGINPNATINYSYASYIASSMMDVTGPRVKFSTVARKGAVATFRWAATDKPGPADLTDVGSGVKSFDVMRKTATGWKVSVAGSKTQSFAIRAPKGTTIRVRAHDKAGNTGAWALARA